MKNLFDKLPSQKIENYLSDISNHIAKGLDKKKIQAHFKLDESTFLELYSIAKANLKNKKFSKKMFMDITDLRFATPEQVATYRAHRLKCDLLVDLGAGIGGQTIAFSHLSKKVIAVEIDPKKIEYAKKNCQMHAKSNVEFICGDLLSDLVIKQIEQFGKPDIVFFDSHREAEEIERTIESVKPNIFEIVKKYSKLTKNLAIEVPPQLTPQKIPKELHCEKEYLSLNGQLNRLTLYFGKLKRGNQSVVSLPDGFTIVSDDKTYELKKTKELNNYLHETQEALLQANLLAQFAANFSIELFALQKKAHFFTSNVLIQNSLVKNYSVLEQVQNNFLEIFDALEKHDAKSIVLRANISPDKYWGERKKYESRLNGTQNLHLFLFDKFAVIAKEL